MLSNLWFTDGLTNDDLKSGKNICVVIDAPPKKEIARVLDFGGKDKEL